MKFIFVVQGEGRGHMTQAIALKNMLVNNGHEISAVIIGKSERRVIPDYFYQKIETKVVEISSPNFLTDKENKHINIPKTIAFNLGKLRFYWKNVLKIKQLIDLHQPDFVVNFYELLCGVYFLSFNSSAKHICIGHQFLLEHKDFQFPKVKKSDKFWYFVNTYFTSSNAHLKLALSFREIPSEINKKIIVVPPLLRREVLETQPEEGGFIQVYMVNSGYTQEILEWHKNNNEVEIVVFSDRKDIADGTIIDQNLTFYNLNDSKFLEMLKKCKAYASTAGFESICEAMYLGKKVLLVPPNGHFEQQCNAYDAVLSGAGIQSSHFDIQALLDFIKLNDSTSNLVFKNWVNSAESVFLKHLK